MVSFIGGPRGIWSFLRAETVVLHPSISPSGAFNILGHRHSLLGTNEVDGAAICRREGKGECQEAGKAWGNEEKGLRGRQTRRRNEMEVEKAGSGREGNKSMKSV